MPTVKPSTVLGRQLGDELRRARESAGISMARAAEVLDCTKGKISRIENGHVPVRSPDLTALMRTYGVEDSASRERLVALARRANRRRRQGWWHAYASVLSDTYIDQIEMESICEGICTYQVQLVPGLLQTMQYGRAVAVASRAWRTAEDIDQFVGVRLARQKRLTGEGAIDYWAVLSEGVLHQQVGGPAVMREQLHHLLAMAQRPNVTIQVLPFSRGAHSSMYGPYLLLTFPQMASLDLVLTETPTGNTWMERETEVACYRALFDDARMAALPPTESLSLIQRVAKEYRS
ncbi:helix-turn-helix domain-containing protein [Streptomyces sp. enrichment culture]|uniref:helix-turn-helix domain-containing protein n=1 Tax=Streptomyces sp. enrichment culture TaxID=1795815 RepID=UPI003F571C2D